MKKKNKHKDFLIAAAAVIFLYLIFSVTKIGCPIKYITGISCAGCGMTRAFLSLFSGDIKKAFEYHPLWILVPPSIVVILCKNKINKRIYKLIIMVIVVLFIVVYLVRMLNPLDGVVVFEPANNIFFKLIGVWRE